MKAGKQASTGLAAAVTTVLDLIGIICLAVFAWFVWPPAALLPIAVGALFASWSAQHGDRSVAERGDRS